MDQTGAITGPHSSRRRGGKRPAREVVGPINEMDRQAPKALDEFGYGGGRLFRCRYRDGPSVVLDDIHDW